MVSSDSQAPVCLSSGKNSTYRPVQISGIASGFAIRLALSTSLYADHRVSLFILDYSDVRRWLRNFNCRAAVKARE